MDVPGAPEVTVQRGEQEEESEMRNVFNPGAQAYAVTDALVKPAHTPNVRELVPGKKVSCVPAGSVPTLAVKMLPATVYETAPTATLLMATAVGRLKRALVAAPSAQPFDPACDPATVCTAFVPPVSTMRSALLLRSATRRKVVGEPRRAPPHPVGTCENATPLGASNFADDPML